LGLGSIIALSNENKEIVERYSYDVFGGPNTTSSIGNPYLFTGRRYDPEAGLYYYRARYYAYDIGRFLQTDPIGYTAGLNLYAYCGNNPIVLIDPWGLCKENGDKLDISRLNVLYHEGMRYNAAIEYGVTVAVAPLLELLSYASHIPDFTIPYGATIPFTKGAYANPDIPVPTGFIGELAGSLHRVSVDALERHAENAKSHMIYHHETMKTQLRMIKEFTKRQRLKRTKRFIEAQEYRRKNIEARKEYRRKFIEAREEYRKRLSSGY
jgi:RHS repeat-associated protein